MFMAKGARNPKAGVAQRIFLQTHIDCPGFSVNRNEPGAAIGELFVLLTEQGKRVQASTTGKPQGFGTGGGIQYQPLHALADQRMPSRGVTHAPSPHAEQISTSGVPSRAALSRVLI